ncbi:MAG: hypothetical protein KKF65_00510 [Nanoarchaeota archaeon]|nr:hypothetical protein [Nanoarchaeota archaeon]
MLYKTSRERDFLKGTIVMEKNGKLTRKKLTRKSACTTLQNNQTTNNIEELFKKTSDEELLNVFVESLLPNSFVLLDNSYYKSNNHQGYILSGSITIGQKDYIIDVISGIESRFANDKLSLGISAHYIRYTKLDGSSFKQGDLIINSIGHLWTLKNEDLEVKCATEIIDCLSFASSSISKLSYTTHEKNFLSYYIQSALDVLINNERIDVGQKYEQIKKLGLKDNLVNVPVVEKSRTFYDNIESIKEYLRGE